MAWWPFGGSKQQTISGAPQAGTISPVEGTAGLAVIRKARDEILVTAKGAKVFGEQRSKITEMREVAKKFSNMMTTIDQFSRQTGEWAVAIDNFTKHLQTQVAQVETVNAKIKEFELEARKVQMLREKQIRAAATPSKSIEIAKQQSAALQKKHAVYREYIAALDALETIVAEIGQLIEQSGNVMKNIGLQETTAKNMAIEADKMGTIIREPEIGLIATITSTYSKYAYLQRQLKDEQRRFKEAINTAKAGSKRVLQET